MKVETEYYKKLKQKKRQQIAFRRFIRGQSTPIKIREWIGLNFMELREILEARMIPPMSWANYGSYWVIDHVAPFWIFNMDDEWDMKVLWNPENLMPMAWKDNNHKQGDLRFSILLLSKRSGGSYITEHLIDRLQKEIKVQDKYLAITK